MKVKTHKMKILDKLRGKKEIQTLECITCKTELMKLHKQGKAVWATCSKCGKAKWKFEEN